MAFLFRVSFLLLFLYKPASAGFFDNEGQLVASQESAQKFKDTIFPGKIVAIDQDSGEAKWHDYASAVPIGHPGAIETKAVLSCAHIWSTEYSSLLYYYHDYRGEIHKINSVELAQESECMPEAQNDLALYYLSDPIPCNPLNEIATELTPTINLLSVGSGWTVVTSENKGIIGNQYGSILYYSENTFTYKKDQEAYVHDYTADRAVTLFDGATCLANYLAPPEPINSAPQSYYHDSGSPWFYQKEDAGYALMALTSRFTDIIVSSPEEEKSMIESILSETECMGWNNHTYTLRVLKLRTPRPFQNILTPLAPHRAWIYEQLLKQSQGEAAS